MTLAERFWSYVEKSDGCWRWLGFIGKEGYGRFGARKGTTSTLAHRVSYELSVGPIPQGLEIDHLCRNRACVNPSHLEPVTREINIRRGISPAARHAKKTHCIRGHEFTVDNIYWGPKNARHCRTCALWRRHGKPSD